MKRAGLFVAAMIVAVLAAGAAAQVRAEVALRAAVEQEIVKGDLKGAIEAYRKIVDGYPNDRAVRAQALVRMGECYQKLGDAQAKQVYERVVREFGDQAKSVAAARAKLDAASRGNQPAALTVRHLVTTTEAVDAISPDGTTGLETDWTNGNIMVRDLGMNRVRPLTSQRPGAPARYDEFGNGAIFSPDASQAAYTWCTTVSASRCDGHLRISRVATGATEKPRVLYSSAMWTRAYDWSPDGRHIAAVISREDRTEHLAVISVADGSARVLRPLGDANAPSHMKFSPDGKHLAYDSSQRRSGTGRLASDVHVVPVSGGVGDAVVSTPANEVLAGWAPDGTQLLFTSDRSGTIDLYGFRLSGGAQQATPMLLRADLGSIEVLRISATGALYHTLQSGGGDQIEMASIDFASGAIVAAPKTAGDPAPGRNTSPQWSPDGSSLLFLSRRPNSSMSLFVRTVATGAVREVRPDLTSFRQTQWGSNPNIVYTLGTNGRSGVGLFSVDLRGGATTLVSRGVLADLQITPDRSRAQFIRTVDRRHHVIELDLTSGREREVWSFDGAGVAGTAYLSPDGAKVYYRRPDEGASQPAPASTLLERDLATGAERVLLEGRLGFIFPSPDGRLLAVPQSDPAGKWRAITLLATSGEPARRELMRVDTPAGLSVSGWSPDSRSIVLTRSPTSASKESWWIPTTRDKPKRLSYFIGVPAIHPDGVRIAFDVEDPEPQRVEVRVMENFLPRTIK
ncbi:MAG: tetratricopeptide repeat protein [Acidobacteriota bacterium]|nr:tetratricopeptide repeat protein [Acidobacteriota bacterium]